MGAGAKNEAIRLTAAATVMIESVLTGSVRTTSVVDGEAVSDDGAARIARLFDHGISRRVDHRIRQLRSDSTAWTELDVDRVSELVASERGMLVLSGSHPNGRVRQRAIELAASLLAPADGVDTIRPPVGVTRMLAQRALDPVPQVSGSAIEVLAVIFATELASERGGRMPNGIERGAREIVAQTRSVIECPELVDAALDLFDNRAGRYVTTGVRDHHRHTLQEVDRRTQLLEGLQVMLPELGDDASRATAARLLDFYARSLVPSVA